MTVRVGSGWIAAAVTILVAVSSCTEGQAAEAQFSSEAGEWAGDYVTVRWRETRHTKHEPEAMVLVIGRAPDKLSVTTEFWAPLICDGEKHPVDPGVGSFLRELFSRKNTTSHLGRDEWDVWMFPKGILPRDRSMAKAGCVTRIVVQARAREGEKDELVLVLPVHDLPMPDHRRP